MGGKWIAADVRPQDSRLYLFEKKFTAKKGASMSASICADTRYKLYVNGKFVCDGPCRGSAYTRYYEQPDLTPYLVEGENTILVHVLHCTEDVFTTVFRGSKPALWFDGTLNDGDDIINIVPDTTWSCKRLDTMRFFTPHGMMPSVPPAQAMDGEEKYTEIPVVELYGPGKNAYNAWGLMDRYPLYPRIIPLLKPDAKQSFILVKKVDGMLHLDAGKYTTAEVSFRFKGRSGSKLYFKYAECYSDADGVKRMRDNTDGVLLTNFYDEITLTGDWQVYEPFWFRAFRYIQVEYEDVEAELDLDNCSFSPYFYPLNENGSFECSDDRLNQIWEISKNTVKCCMHEIFTDCPHYEQQQYGMDTALEIMFAMRMSSDSEQIKKTIIDFVHSQLPDGMLQANFPSIGVQVIPTFSLYWILMVREYMRYTGDGKFLSTLTGTIDKVLTAFDNILTEEGLVGATPYWHYTDWVPGWSAGVPNGGRLAPITVYSLIYANALEASAEICEAAGRTRLAEEYMIRKQAILESVNKYCYDKEMQMYVDVYGYRNFSQHTALWAVLSGAVNGEEATELIERAMNSDVARCAFSMNFYMFRALEKANCYKYADKIMQGWQNMLDMHCTTWCENPDSPRSECHGWSSAPIYEFSAKILGVTPTADGYKAVNIKPLTSGLSWAKGTVPTPYGVISVSWTKNSGKLIFDAQMPQGVNVPVTVELCGMAAFTTNDSSIHIEL